MTRRLERWKQESDLGKPGQMDPDSVRWWRRYASPLIRLAFRPRLEGGENLPDGPYLLVGNHSGLGLAEVLAIIVAWLARFGTSRPIAAMVHPISYNQPGSRKIRRLGAIPSTRPAAMAALAAGVPVLVFPGGDHEAQRPIWQFGQVQFAGRKGFLRIARDAGVPIVPMGIRGSHFTAPVLWRSDRWLAWLLILPKLMGMKRFPLTLLGVIGIALLALLGPIGNWWVSAALAWLWLALPVSQLPWVPWSIRMHIGPPIRPAELFPDDSEAAIDAAYDRVQSAVQALVSPSRLAGEHVHAHDVVLAGDALLAGAAEGIEPLAQLDVAEADRAQDLEELSHRESAGNSTRP